MMRFLIAVLLITSGRLCSGAVQHFYFGQSTSGAADASSEANKQSVTWLNTSGNWGNPKVSGKIGPGDFVHVCGTVSTAFASWAHGDYGNPITFFFETGAKVSNTHWGSGTGGVIVNHNNITVDGNYVGIVECTANGEGLAFTDDSNGILIQSANNCTIQNLYVTNIFVRASGTNFNGGTGAFAVAFRNTGAGYSNAVIKNCDISYAATGVVFEYGPGCSNFLATNVITHYVNHGIAAPDRNSTSSLTRLKIINCQFSRWTNFDDTLGNHFHHNGVFIWSLQGGSSILYDAEITDCTFGPGYGNAYQTSGFYMEGNIQQLKLYNCLFKADPGEYAASGLVAAGAGPTNGLFYINDNTFISGGLGASLAINCGGSYANSITNNLFYSVGGGSAMTLHSITSSRTNLVDYNLVYGFTAGSTYSYSAIASLNAKTHTQWQALGFDLHDVTSDPLLDSSYIPASGSPAINAGKLLGSPFDVDAAGVTRTASPTIGWKEYVSSGGGSVVYSKPPKGRGRR